LQWSGSSPSPPPDPTNWDTITYTYDQVGRRIKKNVVGSHIVKYVYDGGHVIAEYDDSGLLRKYIYGPRVWYTIVYSDYESVILLGRRVRYPASATQETLLKFCRPVYRINHNGSNTN